MNNFLRYVSILFILFCIGTVASAQTVHQVAAGQNGIATAYSNASAGDIIELTTSGGEYIELSPIEITKDITVRAADGLAQKPIVYTSGDNTFRVISAGLNVSGIIFDGTFHGNVICAYPFYIGTSSTITSSDFSLRIDNCEILNFTLANGKGIFSSDAVLTPLDSVIVTNTIFNNLTGYAIYLKTTKGAVFPGGYKYLKWENCLITNITGADGMVSYIESASSDSSDDPEVYINHITAVNMNARGLNVHDVGGAIVQNSIVANVADTSWQAFSVSRGNSPIAKPTTLSNCLYFNANGIDADIQENIINADPMFADTANGDYTLAAGSPGKNAATDGSDLGYIPGGIPTSIAPISGQLPKRFNLSQNYPNPFNPSTTIQFSIPKSGFYSLRVYNLLGQEVSLLLNKEVNTGNYKVNFDASRLSSGLYFYTLSGNEVNITKKMILMK